MSLHLTKKTTKTVSERQENDEDTMTDASANPKESLPNAAAAEVPPVPDELWDLTRVLDPKNKNDEEAIVCMTEGCSSKAVAAWVSNLEPDTEWLCCEECQANDFGGWPDNVQKPHMSADAPTIDTPSTKTYPDKEQVDDELPQKKDGDSQDPSEQNPVATTDAAGALPQDAPKSTASTPETTVEPQETSHPDKTKQTLEAEATPPQTDAMVVEPDEPPVEAWELKKIMSVDELQQKDPVKCCTEGCTLLAACVYFSSLDPDTPWSSCLDCQVRRRLSHSDAHTLDVYHVCCPYILSQCSFCFLYQPSRMRTLEDGPPWKRCP